MDLEEFEVDHHKSDTTTREVASSLSIQDALEWIDSEWHSTSKGARLMDLLGDYAGTEPFIIDGHSLIQLIMEDPLLALGKSGDPSFQILHAFHTLERMIDEFLKRSAVFDVVFWDESRHVTLRTGTGDFEEASRSLARKLLFNHLLKIRQVSVYVFTGLSDPKWREYRFLRKPMFVLINDGGTEQYSTDHFAIRRSLCHRVFLCDLLTSGLALALLAGSQFRDSQVLSFVYESKSRRANDFIPTPVRAACSTAAHTLNKKAGNAALVLPPTSIEPVPTPRALATEDVVLKIASLARFPAARDKILLFAFLIHLVLLPHLSAQDRARKLEPMKVEFKHRLVSDLLPNIFRAMEVAITTLGTTMDVDVRVFIAFVRFLAENSALSLQDILGDEVSSVVQGKLAPFSVPRSAFTQLATEFLPSTILSSSDTGVKLELLPFSNKVFQDILAPVRSLGGDDDGDDGGACQSGEADEGVENDEASDGDEWDTSSEDVEEASTVKYSTEPTVQ